LSTDFSPQRKPKLKALPALTPDQIAAQVAARIAELSAPTPKASPSVKVKSHAELQSSKIARLTTKIAVTEVEIERLKREQVKAQEAVQKSLEMQKTAALAILERRVALEKAMKGSTDDKEFVDAREELETSFSDAKEALANGHPEDVPKILNQDSLLLLRDVAKTGENVMEKITKLFEKMEKEAKEGMVSEGARMVLDALAKKPADVGQQDAANEAILEALAKALSLEEDKIKN